MDVSDEDMDKVYAALGMSAPAKPVQTRKPRVLLTINGETLSRIEWAARFGLTVDQLRKRLARGEPPELATGPRRRGAPSKGFTVWQWINYAKNRPCTDCGGQFHRHAMEFDHCRGEKLFNISDPGAHSLDEVLAEIKKCDLVCACCHRVRTHKRRT
ncbi:MAG: hypothetical protein ACHQ9S_18700 [Candidatus Binatia bacterium]